jgi:hypothetical protein
MAFNPVAPPRGHHILSVIIYVCAIGAGIALVAGIVTALPIAFSIIDFG